MTLFFVMDEIVCYILISISVTKSIHEITIWIDTSTLAKSIMDWREHRIYFAKIIGYLLHTMNSSRSTPLR
jgi:hypothetical protein